MQIFILQCSNLDLEYHIHLAKPVFLNLCPAEPEKNYLKANLHGKVY
jgi:hypothetical protein